MHQTLSKEQAGLLIVDVQEKLFPHVDHPCDILDKMLLAIEGCAILGVPIIVSEQNPKGLGSTIAPIKNVLPGDQKYHDKTSFSCLKNDEFLQTVKKLPIKQWILMGLETHVCILQTARDLLRKGYEVVILNDATSARSIYDFSTAIAELRDMGARISSTETVLFELTEDAKNQKFKEISHLIKSKTCSN